MPPAEYSAHQQLLFLMATTEVILREKINNLGSEADVVTVKAGYARNFLIPEGKAFEASKANLKHLESLNSKRVQREAEELETANALVSKIGKLKLDFALESGQGGKAFGSITTIDIHKELAEKGIEVDRHAIELSGPIKTSGKQNIEIKLHPEVTATLKINVKVDGDDSASASK
jgi:large subunit ribosomal protein L9